MRIQKHEKHEKREKIDHPFVVPETAHRRPTWHAGYQMAGLQAVSVELMVRIFAGRTHFAN